MIEGTASNRVTITGDSWEKNTNNSSGPGIELNSTVAASIKYADIINSNVDNFDWMILIRDASTIENSTISGGRYGVFVQNAATIKNSKIHSFKETALRSDGNSTITGNEIYDSQLDNTRSHIVNLNGGTFRNNRIYSTTNTTDNWALNVDGNVTVEYNTIGG